MILNLLQTLNLFISTSYVPLSFKLLLENFGIANVLKLIDHSPKIKHPKSYVKYPSSKTSILRRMCQNRQQKFPKLLGGLNAASFIRAMCSFNCWAKTNHIQTGIALS